MNLLPALGQSCSVEATDGSRSDYSVSHDLMFLRIQAKGTKKQANCKGLHRFFLVIICQYFVFRILIHTFAYYLHVY